MSIGAISHYLDERKDLSKDDAFAMLCLADWANDDGECYPAMKTLASRMRITDRAAQMAVKRLEKAGELLVIPGEGINTQGGRTMRFVLLSYRKAMGVNVPSSWWKIADARRNADHAKGAKSNSKGVKQASPRKRGEVELQRGEVERAKGVKPASPKPSLEPSFIGKTGRLTPSEREHAAESVLDVLRQHYKAQPLGAVRNHIDTERRLDEHVDLIEEYGYETYLRALTAALPYKDVRYASNIEAQIVRDSNATPAKPTQSEQLRGVVNLQFKN